MKEIKTENITKAISELCIAANYELPSDIKNSILRAYKEETWPIGKDIIDKILKNIEIASLEKLPICQDTGMACIFLEVGQDIHIVGGSLKDAVNEGVREGYEIGYLRKSIVRDPLDRVNTNDNTPGVIYYDIVPGDRLKITVAPKGFGSENMSALKMLKPSDGLEGVKKFIIDTVINAGPNPCPPIVLGVGIGGTFDKVANLAKLALVRSTEIRNKDPFYAALEEELLMTINNLGIGPQGFGGKITALAVNIEVFPTHIAGLPVAVNVNCHVTRHKSIEL